jgi:hypothetical protein
MAQSKWNRHAVNCRYLAERIRGTLLLVKCQVYTTPAVETQLSSSRARYHDHLDWWLCALVRSLQVQGVHEYGLKQAHGAVSAMLREQIDYHRTSVRTMANMVEFFERISKRCSRIALGVVVVDIAFAFLYFLPGWLHMRPLLPAIASEHLVASLCIFVATFAPAVIAASNGIRSQSECDRLADRSEKVLQALSAQTHLLHDAKTPFDLARVAENIVALTASEVSSWSVIYSKSMFEV